MLADVPFARDLQRSGCVSLIHPMSNASDFHATPDKRINGVETGSCLLCSR